MTSWGVTLETTIVAKGLRKCFSQGKHQDIQTASFHVTVSLPLALFSSILQFRFTETVSASHFSPVLSCMYM